MTCREIINEIERWAPKQIAWQKDNVGLQVGSYTIKVSGALLSLELTTAVLEEALKKKCNLIITHHPLLFYPMKKIDVTNDKNSMLIEKLIKNNITLYSAHTNLDYTKDGVSFRLAKVLKLKNIRFLSNLKSNQYKISCFVPEESAEKVADAIFNVGGGVIGDYSRCSFRTKGTGTFKGSGNTNPATGGKNKFSKTNEIKLEVLIDSWKLNDVAKAINASHPYEEIAYDIIPVENINVNYGAGAIGELESPLTVKQFLKNTASALNASLRHNSTKNNTIKKVAVCGGAGIEYLHDAVSAGADAFITADIKYHSFHDAEGDILLIDAGHYETEIHSLDEVKERLEKFIGAKSKIKIYKYSGSTNPVTFYNN